jgi:Xaa-Pro aminopeptidase
MKAPKLPPSFFIKNRYKLYDLLLPGSAVLIASSRQYEGQGRFRQDPDYFYLTGIREPGSFLLLLPGKSMTSFREILFIPRADAHRLRWEGAVLLPEEASALSGIGEVHYTDDFEPMIRELLKGAGNVYYGTSSRYMTGLGIPANEALLREAVENKMPSLTVYPLEPAMMRVRMVKEFEEIQMMKEAIRLTGEAFIRILQEIRPGMHEYEIEAIMTHTFIANGAEGHAFHPIVASGRNALVLHYSKNRGQCLDGELLLMDFGADWNGYAADVSRTIPVSGRFSQPQRLFYDANLRVLQKAMPLMVPGQTLDELNRRVGEFWEEEHIRLGLYTKEETRKKDKTTPPWKEYYWHGTSHSIGLDVHDPYDQNVPFQPGMVFSCEPGFYYEKEGLGIRLENDILITEKEPINLSVDIPIDPDAIEVIMNKSR